MPEAVQMEPNTHCRARALTSMYPWQDAACIVYV